MTKNLISAGALLVITACATPYTPIPFDSEYSPVETIQIVEDTFPAEPTTQKLATNGQNMASAAAGSAGLAGVLVGAVVAGVEANIEAGQRQRIRDALASVGFDGEQIFDDALSAALEDEGYSIAALEVDRKSYRQLVELDADPEASSDTATLDIAGAGYGYQLIGGNTRWRPFVSVETKLVSSADPSNTLMLNRVVYNPVATPDVIVNLSPERKYAFSKVEDLEADPELAAEGLATALTETAVAIAQLLKRSSSSIDEIEISDSIEVVSEEADLQDAPAPDAETPSSPEDEGEPEQTDDV